MLLSSRHQGIKRTEQFWATYQHKKHEFAQNIKSDNSNTVRSIDGMSKTSSARSKSDAILSGVETQVEISKLSPEKLCRIDEEPQGGYISSDPDRLPDIRGKVMRAEISSACFSDSKRKQNQRLKQSSTKKTNNRNVINRIIK